MQPLQRSKASKSLSVEIFRKSFAPVLFIVLLCVLYAVYYRRCREILNLESHQQVVRGAVAIFVLSVTFWVQRIIGAAFGWYHANIAAKTPTRLDDEFIPLFRRIAKITLWVVAAIILLSNLGVNLGALVATLGVGSLAIALAAQDTIANVISGFLIMIDRPFRMGDEIKLPSGEKVKVLDIGIRRSRFLNLDDNAIIIMPNLDLSKSKIINYTYGRERQGA